MVAINCIACVDIVRYAIEILDGDDICNHRCDRVCKAGIKVSIPGLVYVRHYRYLVGVINENIIQTVGNRRIVEILWVRSWMAKAQGVAYLMNKMEKRNTVNRGSVLNDVIGRNIDTRGNDQPMT